MNLAELLKLPIVEKFFTLFILLAGLYLLWGKISKLEDRTAACEDESRKILIEQISKSNVVIEQNTEAFKDFRRVHSEK